MVEIRVETVELDENGGRQIGSVDRATEFLRDRKEDLIDAITQTTAILATSAPELEVAVQPSTTFQIGTVELSFGLTLTAEAGVIVSRIGAEATFEVKVSIDRVQPSS
jgi:hypothetical protein